MPNNYAPESFFSPTLKRISIGFFTLIIICIGLIAYNSPQSLFQKKNDVKSESALQPHSEAAPPDNNSLISSPEVPPTQTGEVNSSTIVEEEQLPNVNYNKDDTANTPITTPVPDLKNNQISDAGECPGKSKPSIKGIIVDGVKYYYKKGSQNITESVSYTP